MKKYVINLKRREDRLEKFKNTCPLDDINVFYGFDGKNDIHEYTKKLEIRNGEKGCFISHLLIYEEIIKNNENYVLIFEDDALFTENFIEKYNNVINDMKNTEIDILYIGGRFTKNFELLDGYFNKFTNNIYKHNIYIGRWFNNYHDRTTHAYIISNKCAKLLVETFHNVNIINIPIDNWLLKIITENKIQIYNSNPLLCYSPLIGDSDIREKGNKNYQKIKYMQI